MTNLRDLYKCSVCGNVVEIVHPGAPALVCCNQPMEKLEAKTQDAGNEKHVPVIVPGEAGIVVKVGSVEHPMEEKHSIRFIEVLTKEQVLRAELVPGQKPMAEFPVKQPEVIEVREYCNIHGLWKK
ncbi:desulfoferrodoxin [Candidatus Formimonas warabiya]|uniref:Desulfoferrodoxin n=1 Tax=Formimonas warabiya TaxID=1761012 RepID=A0A3G1L0H8_FORW1|nr:desulfoferrodoxin [Candidatus Formimonas warabiya]ATW28158.1 desulfoferrodoxin [Candidatus Formimonas warabiya]